MRIGIHQKAAAGVVVAVFCALMVACQTQGGGGVRDGAAGASADGGDVAGRTVVGNPAFPLSAWGSFEDYWAEASEGDAGCTYEEVGPTGTVSRYRLADGVTAGFGIGSEIAVRVSTEVGEGEPHDFAAVDCSTGEVTYWELDDGFLEEMRASAAGSGDDEVYARLGLERSDDDYVLYANPPFRDGAPPGVEDEWTTEDELAREITVRMFDGASDQVKWLILHDADSETVAALVEAYGTDEVERARDGDYDYDDLLDGYEIG